MNDPSRSASHWESAAVVIAAAIAMAATLPGRTHGLGIITTRLLSDFEGLTDTRFAQINLVATLLGSLFCLPCGWLLDRLGAKAMLATAMPSLAVVAMLMSQTESLMMLTVYITLTRGLGQSMLSVVSIAMLAKWFRRDAGVAMGSYAVLMTMLMAVGTGVLASQVASSGWRASWFAMAVVLLIATPLAWWLSRRPKMLEGSSNVNSAPGDHSSATLVEALGSPCFWIFALSISLFGLVSSGVSLFQQLILEECGLSETVYHTVLIVGLLSGLIANFGGGWLSQRWSMSQLLGVAMFLLAGSLAVLPLLQAAWKAYIQAFVAGFAGGLITVLFFAIWSHAFGPKFIGQIQAVAQMMAVLASAVGPMIVATAHEQFGSYLYVLAGLAGVAAMLGIVSILTPVPSAAAGNWDHVEVESVDRLAQEVST